MDERCMKKNAQLIFSAIFILLPALLFGAICLAQYGRSGGGAFLPMPKWNDEAAYYELVKTYLATGMPKGYWGFEGNHAIWGTGSAWSPAILLPYAIWGEMFGWGYGSVAAANIVFLCIANVLMLLFYKPDKQGIGYLFLLEAFSGHILLYLNTIMSEILRYALAMVLAAMLYRLLFVEETGKDGIFRYVIAPLYLITITQVYIFFAFAVPIYMFAVLKKKKWHHKAAIAFLAMAIEAGGSYYLLHFISSNYNIYKAEMLLEALKNRDIFGAVKTFLWMLKVGLLDVWNCFLSYAGHGIFRWFVPFLALLIGLSLLWLCRDGALYLKNKRAGQEAERFWNHDRQMLFIVSYSVGLFVLMYLTVYSLEVFTFYRGVGIVILFSLAFLVKMEKKAWRSLLLGLYAMGIFFIPKNQADFQAERYVEAEVRKEWDNLAAELEKAMPLYGIGDTAAGMPEKESRKEALRWANTAVLYSMEPKLICAMPAGLGVNFAMYADEIVKEAGYLVFSLEEKENLRPDWLEQSHREIYQKYGDVLEKEYFIQYMNREYIVYKKRGG